MFIMIYCCAKFFLTRMCCQYEHHSFFFGECNCETSNIFLLLKLMESDIWYSRIKINIHYKSGRIYVAEIKYRKIFQRKLSLTTHKIVYSDVFRNKYIYLKIYL